jgi:hypothetical protein
MGVVCVVLALAVSGGAIAVASGSSSQIAACVHRGGGGLYMAKRCAGRDRRLRWNITGPQGPRGSRGAAGTLGAPGLQGPPGPVTGAAPSGLTMTGLFYLDGYAGSTGGEVGSAISFPFKLAAAPTVVEVPYVGTNPDPAHCSGTTDSPSAAPGYLCVYVRQTGNVDVNGGCGEVMCVADLLGHPGAATPYGAQVYTRAANAGNVNVAGSWAVTAL